VVDHPEFGRTVDLLPCGQADATDEGMGVRLSMDLLRQLAAVLGDGLLTER
jgi:hypothetical protein